MADLTAWPWPETERSFAVQVVHTIRAANPGQDISVVWERIIPLTWPDGKRGWTGFALVSSPFHNVTRVLAHWREGLVTVAAQP